MAASPMALFPLIKTLATINLYYHFGTHQSTDGASGTLAAVIKNGSLVSGSIQIIRHVNGVLRAKADTKLTAFAKFPVDINISISHNNLYYILNRA